MKFVIPKNGKMVNVGKKLVKLNQGEFETKDKELQLALKGCKDVSEVKTKTKENKEEVLPQTKPLNKGLFILKDLIMSQFSTAQEFTYLDNEDERVLKTTTTNGSLLISLWDGAQYVLSDTITTTGTKIIFIKGERVKFEPTGDMVYSVKEGYLL